MRDINRLDNFYNNLKELHKQLPDWRFGQFIMNFFSWYYQKYKKDCFYIEEKEMLKYIKEFIDDMGIKYI
jgi:hypothetical protein